MKQFIKQLNKECERRAKYLDRVDSLYCALYHAINAMSDTEERMRVYGARLLADIVWNVLVTDNRYAYHLRFAKNIVGDPYSWSGFVRQDDLIRHFVKHFYHLFSEYCFDFGVMTPEVNIDESSIADLLAVVRHIIDGYLGDEDIDVVAANINWIVEREFD